MTLKFAFFSLVCATSIACNMYLSPNFSQEKNPAQKPVFVLQAQQPRGQICLPIFSHTFTALVIQQNPDHK